MEIILSDGRAVEVNIVKKQVKNITLRVFPDGRVRVTAPNRTGDMAVGRFVRSKTAWVENCLKKSEARPVCPEGSVRLLGNNYPVTAIRAPKNAVEVTDDRIVVSAKEGVGQDAVLANWWKKTALEYFELYVDKWMEILKETGIARPRVSVRKMKTRWGSCTSKKGEIRFSYYLLCAPPAAVEYVVLHEIAHLPHPNHGEGFKAFLTKWMPDWKARRSLLKKEMPYHDSF